MCLQCLHHGFRMASLALLSQPLWREVVEGETSERRHCQRQSLHRQGGVRRTVRAQCGLPNPGDVGFKFGDSAGCAYGIALCKDATFRNHIGAAHFFNYVFVLLILVVCCSARIIEFRS